MLKISLEGRNKFEGEKEYWLVKKKNPSLDLFCVADANFQLCSLQPGFVHYFVFQFGWPFELTLLFCPSFFAASIVSNTRGQQ